jgi:hypothetical protein
MPIITDPKKAATVIVSQFHAYPHGGEEHEEGEDDESGECEALGREVLDAFASKDAMAVYNALKAVFLKVDSEPHEEGEHDELEDDGPY